MKVYRTALTLSVMGGGEQGAYLPGPQPQKSSSPHATPPQKFSPETIRLTASHFRSAICERKQRAWPWGATKSDSARMPLQTSLAYGWITSGVGGYLSFASLEEAAGHKALDAPVEPCIRRRYGAGRPVLLFEVEARSCPLRRQL